MTSTTKAVSEIINKVKHLTGRADQYRGVRVQVLDGVIVLCSWSRHFTLQIQRGNRVTG